MRRFPHVNGVAHVPYAWVHRGGGGWLCGPEQGSDVMRPVDLFSTPCVVCSDHLTRVSTAAARLHNEFLNTTTVEGMSE